MAEQRHYFSAADHAGSRPGTVAVRVAGLDFSLHTDAEVFSRDRLDPGTGVLLREMPWPDRGTVLDLGCGYGPIACAIGLRCPDVDVVGTDVNARALELLRRNASALSLPNVAARAPDDVPAGTRFDAIYSNPPVRVGKQALHEMVLRWLPRLADGGRAYLVVQRNLGADSLARWLGDQDYAVTRLSSHRGYRVLEVARP